MNHDRSGNVHVNSPEQLQRLMRGKVAVPNAMLKDKTLSFEELGRRVRELAEEAEAVVVPVKTISELNRDGGHWSGRHARAKKQRQQVFEYCMMSLDRFGPDSRGPLTVELTRLAPGTLDDDNLQGALKHVRDGVADYFGRDDGTKFYRWKYAQRTEKFYAVIITISEGLR